MTWRILYYIQFWPHSSTGSLFLHLWWILLHGRGLGLYWSSPESSGIVSAGTSQGRWAQVPSWSWVWAEHGGMKGEKIRNKTFSNNRIVERGEEIHWRAGGAPGRLQIFIREKDLFSSIRLDSGGEICIFLRRCCNPAEWAGVGSMGHLQSIQV